MSPLQFNLRSCRPCTRNACSHHFFSTAYHPCTSFVSAFYSLRSFKTPSRPTKATPMLSAAETTPCISELLHWEFRGSVCLFHSTVTVLTQVQLTLQTPQSSPTPLLHPLVPNWTLAENLHHSYVS